MSALAARRAAQLAKAALASEPAETPEVAQPPKAAAAKASTPAKATRKAAAAAKSQQRKPASPKVAAPKQAAPAAHASDDETEAEPSRPSSKRRKVASARYYPAADEEAEVQELPAAAPKRKRQSMRAFSPSAPQLSDASSDAGSSADEQDNYDEGEVNAPGSGAATPWFSRASSPQAGPSRSATTLRAGTSHFEPRDAVNVVHLKESALKAAGVMIPGPGVVISLGRGEDLLIAGAYTITPLRQSVSLLSTTIHPSYEGEELEAYPVFAPTSHPIPVVTAAANEDMLLESPLMARLKLPKGFDTNPSRTLFLVQEHRSGIEGLRGEVVPGFNNIWVDDGLNAGPWGLRGVHPVLNNFSMPVYPHCTGPSWHAALDSLIDRSQEEDDDMSPPPQERVPIVLVKGAKRSGKSSLARAALNRLLTRYERVAWLECDLGQSEFGCGGVVGLWVIDSPVLGPTFTHPRIPARAHYLGELSPQSCPDEYMEAIHQLVTHYQYEVQYPLTPLGGRRNGDAVPLVVNTQGWVKGLGEDLLRAIEACTEPTHVFAFKAPVEERARNNEASAAWTTSPVHQAVDLPFASGAGWQGMQPHSATATRPQVFAIEPAPSSPLQARYTAADMRSLSTISYMSTRFAAPSSLTICSWDFSVPLLAVHPWTVSLGTGQALSRVFLIGESADAIVPSDLPLALNGSLVALLESSSMAGGEDQLELYVPATRPVAEDTTFLGLALVRAVRPDPSSSSSLQLQVVTPLPANVLARAHYIVRNGGFELPTPAMLDFRDRPTGGAVSDEGLAGVRWDEVPFFDATESRHEVVGGAKRRFRRNLQRKGV